jgi:hypothetical protein
MGMFDGLKRLFAGSRQDHGTEDGVPDRENAIDYKGYRIVPAPRRQGGQYLTAGVIEKDFADGTKTYSFVRADTFQGADDAKTFALTKGKQIVDYEGDRMFKER